MPEIRLGSNESMTNINLGSVEIEEVRLGTILIWRNNVLPFFALNVNGTLVSSNGTPLLPVDPDTPEDAALMTFEYDNTVTITISNIQDEEMQYPITFNLYKGDFAEDETLTPIGSQVLVNTATPGLGGTWDAQDGKPVPGGAAAANFIEADQLYSVVGEDSEEGISIQYFKLTVTDSSDTFVFGGWTNSGATYDPFNSVSAPVASSITFNTQCFDAESTLREFNRVTTTPLIKQDQVRTCAVQVHGIQDTPAKVCVASQMNQTINVSNGSSSFVDQDIVDTNFTNTGFVAGIDVVTSTVGGPNIFTVGTCVPNPSNCGFFVETCDNGSAPQFAQFTFNQLNCAGTVLANIPNGAAFPNGSTQCDFANPVFLPQGLSGSITVLSNGARWTGTMNRDSGSLTNIVYNCADSTTDTGANRSISCTNAADNPSTTGTSCAATRSALGNCSGSTVVGGSMTVTSGTFSQNYTF